MSEVSSRRSDPDGCAGRTDLPEVLLKVAELETLLKFQVVLGPELLKGVVCLLQLSQEPGSQSRSVFMLQELLAVMSVRNKPLHGGLVLHFIRTQFGLLRLGRLLSDAAQQSGALFQR